ncbi:MAG: glycosyltransferase, partial [Brevibacterium sp.]|nr:glycosyltransferase [Brevibacterium sp.]
MTSQPLHTLRTALWHLRNGGIEEMRQWHRRRSLPQGAADSPAALRRKDLSGTKLTDMVPALPKPQNSPIFEGLKVGVILDDFSMESFGYEWSLTQLLRTSRKAQLDGLDFIFIESAWNGNSGSWKFKLTGTAGPSTEIRDLLTECRNRG